MLIEYSYFINVFVCPSVIRDQRWSSTDPSAQLAAQWKRETRPRGGQPSQKHRAGYHHRVQEGRYIREKTLQVRIFG